MAFNPLKSLFDFFTGGESEEEKRRREQADRLTQSLRRTDLGSLQTPSNDSLFQPTKTIDVDRNYFNASEFSKQPERDGFVDKIMDTFSDFNDRRAKNKEKSKANVEKMMKEQNEGLDRLGKFGQDFVQGAIIDPFVMAGLEIGKRTGLTDKETFKPPRLPGQYDTHEVSSISKTFRDAKKTADELTENFGLKNEKVNTGAAGLFTGLALIPGIGGGVKKVGITGVEDLAKASKNIDNVDDFVNAFKSSSADIKDLPAGFDPVDFFTRSKQGYQEASNLIEQATKVDNVFKQGLDEIGKSFGFELKHADVKGPDRLVYKSLTEPKYGGSVDNAATDLNRGTFVSPDPLQDYSKIASAIEAKFGPLDTIKNNFDEAEPGSFRSFIIKFRTKDGIRGEAQVTTPEMWRARSELGGHKMYDVVRVKGNDWENIEVKMKQLYDDADSLAKSRLYSSSEISLPSTRAFTGGYPNPLDNLPNTSSVDGSRSTMTGVPSTSKNLGNLPLISGIDNVPPSAPIVAPNVTLRQAKTPGIDVSNVQTMPQAFQLSRRLEDLGKGGFEEFKVGEMVKNFDEPRLKNNPIETVMFDQPFVGKVNGKDVNFEANIPYVVSGHNRFEILKRAKAEGKVTSPDDEFFKVQKAAGNQQSLDTIINESISTNVKNKSIKDINLLDLYINGRVNRDDMVAALAFDPSRAKFFDEIAQTFRSEGLNNFWNQTVSTKLKDLRGLDFGTLQEKLNFVGRIGKKLKQVSANLNPEQKTALENTLAGKVSEVLSLEKRISLQGVENNIARHLESIQTGGFTNEKLMNLWGEEVVESTVNRMSGVTAVGKAIDKELDSRYLPEGARVRLLALKARLDDPAVQKIINEKSGLTSNAEKTLKVVDDYLSNKLKLPEGPTGGKVAGGDDLPLVAPERLPGQELRQIPISVRESPQTAPAIAKAVKDQPYDVLTNKQSLEEARAALDENFDGAIEAAKSGEFTGQKGATVIEAIRRLSQEGKHERAVGLVEDVAERWTKAGQAVQVASIIDRLSPEGVLLFAQRQFNKAREAGTADVKLTEGLSKELIGMVENIKKFPEGSPERARETGKLINRIQRDIPKGILSQVAMVQYIAQLLNPKTAIRNLGGNAFFFVTENVKDVIGAPLDMVISLITKNRTKTLPNIPNQLVAGYRYGKEGVKDVLAGVDTAPTRGTQLGLPKTKTFDPKAGKHIFRIKNWIGDKFETALGLVLKPADRAFFGAAYEESLRQQMRLAKPVVKKVPIYKENAVGQQYIDGYKEVKEAITEPDADMVKIATADGLYRTFQDPNLASEALTKMKKGLNLGKEFGIGSVVLNYPRTPGALLMRGIEYSPVGFLGAVLTLGKGTIGKGFNQKLFVDQTSRALLGTTALFGTGALMHKLGLITGKEDVDDPDVRAYNQKTGLRNYQLNVSALQRFIFGGFDPEDAKRQEGDFMASYDWLQPNAIDIAMGAEFDKHQDDIKGLFGKTLASVAAAATTITEQPLLTGITRLFGKGDAVEGLLETALAIPSTFIPTVLNQTRQLVDTKARDTRDPDPVKEAINNMKLRVPGLAQSLPTKKDPATGEDLPVYASGNNNIANVFLNPAITSQFKQTEMGKEIIDLYNSTGESTHFPRTIGKSIRVGEKTVQLNGEQINQLQEYVGKRTKEAFEWLVDQNWWDDLSDEDKIKEMSNAMTEIHTAAKMELFGQEPSRPDRGAYYWMDRGDNLPLINR